MFPLDRGESVGDAVSHIIEMIKKSGHDYRLTAMGTIIETERLSEALELVDQAYLLLQQRGAKRVYATIKLDIREGKTDRLTGKIQSIQARIGEVST